MSKFCKSYEDVTDMFDWMRRRNLIESGKYNEEEVDNYSEEWMSPKSLKLRELEVKENVNEDCSNS